MLCKCFNNHVKKHRSMARGGAVLRTSIQGESVRGSMRYDSYAFENSVIPKVQASFDAVLQTIILRRDEWPRRIVLSVDEFGSYNKGGMREAAEDEESCSQLYTPAERPSGRGDNGEEKEKEDGGGREGGKRGNTSRVSSEHFSGFMA